MIIIHVMIPRLLTQSLNLDYFTASKQEMQFWRQISSIRWLREGEANTKYYHSLVKDRRRRQPIRQVELVDGTLCDAQSDIQQATMDYYTSLFVGHPTLDDSTLLDSIPQTFSAADNMHLTSMATEDEVKQAVWTLDPHSAAGPDGYNGCFFRTC